MSSLFLSPHDIEIRKREAKNIKKLHGYSHSKALDIIASKDGFSSWNMLLKSVDHAFAHSPEVKAILDWFNSWHFATSNPFKFPVVSVPHVLERQFPNFSKSLVSGIAARLESQGLWASKPVMKVIDAYKPEWRERLISGRYAPCRILQVEAAGDNWFRIHVPVARAYAPEKQYGGMFWGQLVFKCPVCGDRHFHGAGGPNFGDGTGDRTKHCVLNPTQPPKLSFGFHIEEQRTPELVGHLKKHTREAIWTPQ